MNKISKKIKNILNYIKNSYIYESKRTSYIRLIILCILILIFWVFLLLFVLGNMLIEKVLIFNPENITLSIEAFNTIKIFEMYLRLLFGLTLLSILTVAYKEYQEICANKIIKKYQIDVIK